jgi:hypothetical protein
MLIHHQFKRGHEIKLSKHAETTRKKVPAHVERVFKEIKKVSTNKKSSHDALCKSVEIIFRATRKKTINRHQSDHDFYKRLASYKTRDSNYLNPFRFNLKRTVESITALVYKQYAGFQTSFFHRVPASVIRLSKILADCDANKDNPFILHKNIREMILLAHDATKVTFCKDAREIELMQSVSKALVFRDVDPSDFKSMLDDAETSDKAATLVRDAIVSRRPSKSALGEEIISERKNKI